MACLLCLSAAHSLNLDSMQPEPPPEGFWAKVVDKANLQPQQRNQVFWVFECYQDQRAALLQQQQHIVEALQQLLGPDNSANSTADAVTPAEREQPAPGAPASDGVTVPAASLSVGLSDLQRQSQGGECAEASTISGTAAAGPACARMSACDSSKASSMFPGMLDLEVAEEVEQLLQQLQRVVRLQRESSRRLVLLWMDLLTSEQHVDAILAAYPFTVKVPAGKSERKCVCVPHLVGCMYVGVRSSHGDASHRAGMHVLESTLLMLQNLRRPVGCGCTLLEHVSIKALVLPALPPAV